MDPVNRKERRNQMSNELTPQAEESLRQAFKTLNRFMLLMWRLGLGYWINFWPGVVGRIMVITHTGRKTGLRRRTPVNYALIDGEIYCIAGFGKLTDWYRNIIANPDLEVWLPDSWWAGVAEDISDSEDRLSLLREVIIASGFAGRLAGLDPYNMSDEAFTEATAEYRLLRIRRSAPRTGPEGPGDLAWIWPLATLLLLPLVFLRPKKRR
jgi:deazaflavin-dependent oxidoreductase (nitroreductase family)